MPVSNLGKVSGNYRCVSGALLAHETGTGVSKQRTGAKVHKTYDRAATPHARATTRDDLAPAGRKQMNTTMEAIRPAELYRQIRELTIRLEHLALAKTMAPVKSVNTAFVRQTRAKVLPEAMIQASRRI